MMPILVGAFVLFLPFAQAPIGGSHPADIASKVQMIDPGDVITAGKTGLFCRRI